MGIHRQIGYLPEGGVFQVIVGLRVYLVKLLEDVDVKSL